MGYSDLNGDGVFRVKDVRNLLDEFFLPRVDVPTRWVKNIPIKLIFLLGDLLLTVCLLERISSKGMSLLNRSRVPYVMRFLKILLTYSSIVLWLEMWRDYYVADGIWECKLFHRMQNDSFGSIR
nr:RNA-directed DNA polymerase, eukaryota [Tanacetum cinerariifolium]